MKIVVVEYPFDIEQGTDREGPCDVSQWHYPTMRDALKDARDRFQARDEYEDAQDLIGSDVDPLSRRAAKVYELDVTVMRSWVCDLLNTGAAAPFDGGVHVNDLKYRKGRIVASKPVAPDAEGEKRPEDE